jgi:hypothetical protein
VAVAVSSARKSKTAENRKERIKGKLAGKREVELTFIGELF